jgi:hypothetical protein
VSETVRHPPDVDVDPLRRAPRPSWVRLAVEFILLFAIAIVLKQFVVTGTNYPNPLWLPVVVLSLEHGLAAGLTATILAIGAQYSGGFPPAYLTEDMYSYIGRIATEPVSWACVALLIGHFRSRQIANFAELQAELAERSEHCTVVADLCVDLRSRTELLERHIAANAHASNVDVAEAIGDLHSSGWENFAPRLTRFIVLMTGAAEFSVFLLRDNAFKLVFQPNEQHIAAGDVTVVSDDPLFAAIVNERRTLWGSRMADRDVLGNRGTLATPLLDRNGTGQVAGMLVIGGATLDDYSEDIDRRIALTANEISPFLGRIILIESWHAAAAPGQSNGHLNPEKPAAETVPADTSASPVATNGGKEPDREMTLQ